MKNTGFTRQQKALIAGRDLDCVIHYGNHADPQIIGPCGGDLTHHHLKNRGAGGVKSRNRVANGLLICTTANSRLTHDAAFIAYAYERGWYLRTDYEIGATPVWSPRLNRFVYLSDDGDYLDISHNRINQKAA
jgi:hypothetical protein